MAVVFSVVLFAAIMMACYQGFRGGFDYTNQIRIEAKVNMVLAPRWLQALMVFALLSLLAALVLIWSTQVWLIALAMTLATLMISVSIKMLVMPRSESEYYQRYFGALN